MTYPANEKAPAAQFCPQCGSHVPRIAELERQLTHAPIANLEVFETGFVVAELYAPGLPAGKHDVYCAPVSERERIAELEKVLREISKLGVLYDRDRELARRVISLMVT